MAEKRATPVLMKGRGMVPMTLDHAIRGKLVLEGALKDSIGETRPVRLVPRGDTAVVRTHLGRNAPAGTHSAMLKTEDGEVKVTIEVPERARLRLRPSRLEITGKPGGKAQADLMVENRGNVAASLPSTAVAGLFASDGVAGAFSRAYGVESDDPNEIFGEFVLGLRRNYLGLMHVKFSGAEEPLEPGEHRAVKAEFKIPKAQNEATQTGKGRRFHTIFVLGGPRLTVRLTIA
jgi:hypothetical protein